MLDGRQTVKLLRWREVLIVIFGEFQLVLFYHIHKLNACEYSGCGMHFPETPHRRCNPFNMAMILFNNN
jgi:hypothetical protein